MAFLQITKFDGPQYEPRLAIVIHQQTDATMGSHGALVTRHPIETTPSGPRLCAGTTLSDQDLVQLADAFQRDGLRRLQGDGSRPALLDQRILGTGTDYLIWRMPAKIRPMWFRTASDKSERLDVPWPNLVAIARVVSTGHINVSIAALRSKGNPKPGTRLFHAPLMNVGATGLLCQGSATRPEQIGPDTVDGWEAVFTESAFSHVNHDNTLGIAEKVSTSTHHRFWRSLQRDKATRFPNEQLVPLGMTFEEWLSYQ